MFDWALRVIVWTRNRYATCRPRVGLWLPSADGIRNALTCDGRADARDLALFQVRAAADVGS